MKLMRLAMCVAVFALVGGIAMSEDLDVRALQAKLAAQEARLNDMQAKMAYSNNASSGSVADGVLSLKKNAVVTIGGNVNTRYFGRSGKISINDDADLDTPVETRPAATRTKIGDLRISDAQLFFKIDVNDYFDAWVALEMQNSLHNAADNAKQYWVRWKNLCNSGFGVLVGRSDLVFGDGGTGVITSYTAGDSGGFGDALTGINPFGPRIGWDRGRTTQITPYWESQDGKIKAELSFIQGIDELTYGHNGLSHGGYANLNRISGDTYRSHNYGVGSASARIVVNPIEGLKLSASLLSLYNNNNGVDNFVYSDIFDTTPGNDVGNVAADASRNTAFALAFRYRPACFNRLNIWSQWVHAWNDGFIKDRDSDSVNFGASFDITDQVTFFAQGDYIRVKQDGQQWNGFEKATGWAFYTGLQYRLPYGVDFEVGYRHDKVNYKGGAAAGKWAKIKADTIYGHLGFNF